MLKFEKNVRRQKVKGLATLHMAVQVPHVGFVTTDCHLAFLYITANYRAESYEPSNFDLWPACIFIFILILNLNYSKGKGKAIPLQAWTCLEGSSRLRLPDFKTIGT